MGKRGTNGHNAARGWIALALVAMTLTSAYPETNTATVPVTDNEHTADADRGLALVRDRPFHVVWRTAYSEGQNAWQVQSFDFDPVFGFADHRTRLKWEDSESWLHMIQASYLMTDWLRFEAVYGFGDIRDGDQTESDWVSDAEVRDFLLARSVAETAGDVAYYQIGVAAQVHEWLSLPTWGGHWELQAGYRNHQETVKSRNGVLVVDLEEEVNQPFTGLDANYTFEWKAFYAGARGRVALTPRWSIHGGLLALFGVDYRGDGFLNLRSDLRTDAPNIRHRAKNGVGLEGQVALSFHWTPAFYTEVGYTYFRVRARNGSERRYLFDDETEKNDLDWARTRRSGVFMGIGGRF